MGIVTTVLLTEVICMVVIIKYGVCFNNVIQPSCEAKETVCEFHWNIDYFQTMALIPPNGKGQRQPILPINDTLFVRTDCGTSYNVREARKQDKFVTGDGIPKFMFAINDQVPGPSIVVHEGQQIIVHVHNNLYMEGVSIHWHGLPQKGTPYMDGVARVTQCPINPGETFTYKFKAEPYGTYWYHSHLGAQRSDGLAGALIILKKPQERRNKDMPTNFVFLVEDWFHRGYTREVKLADWNLNKYVKNARGDFCADIKRTYDNSVIGQKGRQSPVINAKGRFYDPYEENIKSALPLEMFVVQRHQSYVFRIVGMAAVNSYRISIDDHKLKIIAIDGSDIEAVEAESIIIQSGERFDVEIYTDAPIGNYWIRLEDMAVQDNNGESIPMTTGFGILRYDGATEEDPVSKREECSETKPCRVINCLFGKFPPITHLYCTPISELQAKHNGIQKSRVPVVSIEDDMQEFFLNFHYSVMKNNPETAVSTINGIRMSLPTIPPLMTDIFPMKLCPASSSEFASECTHMLKLNMGKVIQFVLINFESTGFGRPHPIHMHGHKFYVLKIGFPDYDPESGKMIRMNEDIVCESATCNSARWANSSWQFGNVPGLNLQNPPLKDTIIVPWGGYAVIRITADNPGYWYMHCHIELHNIDGMAIILQEGEQTDIPKRPTGMPVCGDMPNILQQKVKNTVALLQQTGGNELTVKSDMTPSSVVGITIMGVIVSLSLVLNIVGVLIVLRRRLSSYSLYFPKKKQRLLSENTDEAARLLK